MFKIRTKDLGIDLGTANTLVYVKGKGIVLREPSIIATETDSNKILSIGHAAKEVLGRAPKGVAVVQPLKNGVIADYDSAAAMIKHFLMKSNKKSLMGGKPFVMICVPSSITAVERRAVTDAAKEAGARDAYVIEEALAAALGADLAVWEPIGTMVVDIGGGTTEAAVIPLGGIVAGNTIRVAGNEMDKAISNYVRKRYNLRIGEHTAESIKVEIGSAGNVQDDIKKAVRGRDMVTGLPKTIEIAGSEISNALSDSVNAIVDTVKRTLEETPPELAADIMDRGITLTGGGALLNHLDNELNKKTGIPIFIAQDPLDCTALGVGKALDQISLFKSGG